MKFFKIRPKEKCDYVVRYTSLEQFKQMWVVEQPALSARPMFHYDVTHNEVWVPYSRSNVLYNGEVRIPHATTAGVQVLDLKDIVRDTKSNYDIVARSLRIPKSILTRRKRFVDIESFHAHIREAEQYA